MFLKNYATLSAFIILLGLVLVQPAAADDLYAKSGPYVSAELEPGEAVGQGFIEDPEAEYPAVAFNGSMYLVGWACDDESDINVTRIMPDGTVLDDVLPITIATMSPPTGYSHHIAVTSDGSNFLVVWSGSGNLYGTRVTPEGTILDPGGFVISNAANVQMMPDALFDGIQYFAAWDDQRDGGTDIYGARIDTSGNVLDPDGIPISTATSQQSRVDLAFDGTNYFAAWQDYRTSSNNTDIYGARITTNGTVLDPDGIEICARNEFQRFPDVEFNGLDFFVVWQDDYPNHILNDIKIMGARVTSDGVRLDNPPIEIADHTVNHYLPAVACDGTICFVTWGGGKNLSGSEEYGIWGARVNQSGTKLDSYGVPLSLDDGLAEMPDVVLSGTDYFLVWKNERNLYANHFDGFGNPIEASPLRISNMPSMQWDATVASDGTDFLVLWNDWRHTVEENNSRGVYASRVTAAGEVLDGSGIRISSVDAYGNEVVAAFGGDQYLVSWISGQVYGGRITPAGQVLDAASFEISHNSSGNKYDLDMASDGSNFLVTWRDRRNGQYDVFGSRVGPDGSLLDAQDITICDQAEDEYYQAVAYGDGIYLVVWTDKRNLATTNRDIYATRVADDGTVLDPGGFPITTAVDDQTEPDVAFDGTDFHVVWQDDRHDPETRRDLYAARVDTAGNVDQETALYLSTDSIYDPALAYNGSHLLATYYSSRSYVYQGLYGVYFAPDGTVETPAGFEINLPLGAGKPLDVASNENGASLTVLSREETFGAHDSYRLYANLVQLNNNGTFCSQPGDCDSGFCVEAVCCETACEDDGLFCNGGMTCATGACDATAEPCNPVTQTCNETDDICESAGPIYLTVTARLHGSWSGAAHTCESLVQIDLYNESMGLIDSFFDITFTVEGEAQVDLTAVAPGNYYVVLRHLNHVDLITAAQITWDGLTSVTVDFTNPANVECGESTMYDIGGGVWTMPSGDIDPDDRVALADFNYLRTHWTETDPACDLDCDGFCRLGDFNKLRQTWNTQGCAP